MLGYILRTCRDFKNIRALKSVYNALVRSHLDYCSSIWNQPQQCFASSLEMIQRKFTRFLFYKKLIILHENEFHYIPCLQKLNLQTLENRRKRYELIMLTKVLAGEINLTSTNNHIRVSTNQNMNLRSHRSLTTQPNCSTNLNRWIKVFLDYKLDFSIIINSSLTAARNLINATIPLYWNSKLRQTKFKQNWYLLKLVI